MSIQGDFGVETRPKCFKLATVKRIHYDPNEETSLGNETIHMETTDGDTFDWCISTYNSAGMEEFLKVREGILSGKITSGTEVTVKYNSKGIFAFAL